VTILSLREYYVRILEHDFLLTRDQEQKSDEDFGQGLGDPAQEGQVWLCRLEGNHNQLFLAHIFRGDHLLYRVIQTATQQQSSALVATACDLQLLVR
jgi:hypothetical protein